MTIQEAIEIHDKFMADMVERSRVHNIRMDMIHCKGEKERQKISIIATTFLILYLLGVSIVFPFVWFLYVFLCVCFVTLGYVNFQAYKRYKKCCDEYTILALEL